MVNKTTPEHPNKNQQRGSKGEPYIATNMGAESDMSELWDESPKLAADGKKGTCPIFPRAQSQRLSPGSVTGGKKFYGVPRGSAAGIFRFQKKIMAAADC
jgi:hypothetical protein